MTRLSLTLSFAVLACAEPRPATPPTPPEVVIPDRSGTAPGPCHQNGKCVVEGQCELDGETCVARSDDACGRSLACELFGRCSREGDVCVTTEAGCRASLGCRQHGYCGRKSEAACEDASSPAPPSDATILSPTMQRAMELPLDDGWVVGQWLARPPPSGPDSYSWEADLEIRKDGTFELTEGETYPEKHPCTLAGDVRVADFVMIQRVSRSSCPEIPPGTWRTFALFRYPDEIGLKALYIGGMDALQSTAYRRAGRTGPNPSW